MAVSSVSFHLALDPGLGLVASVTLGVISHNLGVGQHGRHEVEVIQRHFAEDESGRVEDLLHWNARASVLGSKL